MGGGTWLEGVRFSRAPRLCLPSLRLRYRTEGEAMSVLHHLFSAELTLFGQHILWREILGNAFGFASAIGGLRRRVWAWPIGIAGNALLFTVFFGVAFSNPQATTLFGQA